MALIATDREDLEPGVQPSPELMQAPLVPLGTHTVDDEFAGYADYYAPLEELDVFLPDNRQYLRIKKMTEGDRARYLKATRSDVTINQRSGDAKIPFDQAGERKALIVASVVNWHVVKRDPRTGRFGLQAFRTQALEQWIDIQSPDVLADVEKKIRLFNPWLINEMTVEQIDKEIENLQELRKAAVVREAEGKDSENN